MNKQKQENEPYKIIKLTLVRVDNIFCKHLQKNHEAQIY